MTSSYHSAVRTGAALLGCAGLIALAGCGSSTGVVTGRAEYKGAPLPSGMVSFVSQDGKVATGNINNGQYTVDNVPTGPAKIAVKTIAAGPAKAFGAVDPSKKNQPPKGVNVPPEMLKAMQGAGQSGSGVSVPAKYSDPDQSGLTYTVKSGQNTFDIDLKEAAEPK